MERVLEVIKLIGRIGLSYRGTLEAAYSFSN